MAFIIYLLISAPKNTNFLPSEYLYYHIHKSTEHWESDFSLLYCPCTRIVLVSWNYIPLSGHIYRINMGEWLDGVGRKNISPTKELIYFTSVWCSKAQRSLSLSLSLPLSLTPTPPLTHARTPTHTHIMYKLNSSFHHSNILDKIAS